jgi:hypothetical protein
MIPASMSMSLYNTPSSASAAEGGSSSSSSGYSGTPSTLSLEDSGTELCRSDSTCTLVSTPSWARKEDHGDGNYDRIFCIEASNNRDSGCEVAESPSQKHESISSIMIGTVERKREREQRKQAERGAKRYRDRNVLHAEG